MWCFWLGFDGFFRAQSDRIVNSGWVLQVLTAPSADDSREDEGINDILIPPLLS